MSIKKCLKNHAHIFVTVEEYDTHIVKQCTRCHTKNWQARRTEEPKTVPVPTSLNLAYFE